MTRRSPRSRPAREGHWRSICASLFATLLCAIELCLAAGTRAESQEAELPDVQTPRPPEDDLRKNLPPIPLIPDEDTRRSACESIVQIEVFKYDRRLKATCADGQVVQFPIALGRRPFGDKQRQGDQRTPEGYYRVAEEPRPSQFHVFIALDYPSAVDADQALGRGEIDPNTYLSIVRAILQGRLPPQDTALGGAIGIHGEGEGRQGRSTESDWTLGCIALSDRNARFLGERVGVGTPVVIRP